MKTKFIEQFIPLVDAIAQTFGKNCEVVLHDLSNPEKSIIKIVNGYVTGRKVGDPITDLGLLLYEKAKKKGTSDSLIGYRTKTKKGKELKSTTVYLRDNSGQIVGCLCINIDTTPFMAAKNMIEDFFSTTKYTDPYSENESPEKFESSVKSLTNELLEKAIKKIGKPPGYMEKDEKLAIIRELKDRGLFHIRGAAKRVSEELNVSLPTIYKYLEEI